MEGYSGRSLPLTLTLCLGLLVVVVASQASDLPLLTPPTDEGTRGELVTTDGTSGETTSITTGDGVNDKPGEGERKNAVDGEGKHRYRTGLTADWEEGYEQHVRRGGQRHDKTHLLPPPPVKTLGWFLEAKDVDVKVVPVVTRLLRPSPTHSPPTHPGTHQAAGEETSLTVEFRAHGHHLVLLLHPTSDLLAASYTEPPAAGGAEGGGGGGTNKEARMVECEYQGVVQGVASSWVALSLCNGISGVVVAGDQELLVEPLPGSSTMKDLHRVFSSSLLHVSHGSCGVERDVQNNTSQVRGTTSSRDSRRSSGSATRYQRAVAASHRRRRGAFFGGPLWTASTTRFVELVLVADRSYYVKYGAQTWERCRSIVNIVNGLYRPLGVVVVLVHLEVWQTGDRITVTSSYKDNLDQMKEYRQKLMAEKPNLNHDNTVLLTWRDFAGSTVGFATVGGMCSRQESVAVIQDKQKEVGVVAQTMAHEMGHNLNMRHDDDSEGCQCDSRKCLMDGTGSSLYDPTMGWSSCSKQYLAVGFESNSFECLKNVPPRLFAGSSCGNGVVEVSSGEQCDCGLPGSCDNPCCDPHTCTFTANATCASGSCCDTQTCQLKGEGNICREALNECDLPEYCSSDSETCPDNVHKGNGFSCRNGTGHCHEGQCGSHEGRCREIWGHTATTADPYCFRKNNRNSSYGNCGFADARETTFRHCSSSDIACGTLHCQRGLSEDPKLQGSYRTGYITFGDITCDYILATSNVAPSLWLAPDGASCGENKMCVNQRCQELSVPEGDCSGGCSGRGVCNSRGHCHCDAGYAPPDCRYAGRGGSFDSGPMEPATSMKPLVGALLCLGFIMVLVLLVMCCCWNRLQWWWERAGRPACPACCASCIDACCCPLMSKAVRWVLTIRLYSKQKKTVQKEVCQEEEKDRMVCGVDRDIKNCPQHTNSWGVANEKLITKVVTLTPTNSPDMMKKHPLPSSSPIFHHKSVEELDRPSYLQSVSVDSGCVADVEDVEIRKPLPSQMSMTSLLNAFKGLGSRQSKGSQEIETRQSRNWGSQKTMPLSRFVVDPLVGSRSSRHGTPPPDHMKPGFRRSVSTDIAKGRPTAAPPLPPPTTNTHNSNSTLDNVPKLADNPFVHSQRVNNSVNSSSSIKSTNKTNHNQESLTKMQKRPLMPPRKSCSPPLKTSPTREAPPPPAPTTASGDQAKTPMMPPWKGKTTTAHSKPPARESDPANNTKPPKPTYEGSIPQGPAKPTKGPLMPPNTGPPKPFKRPGPPDPPGTTPTKPPKNGPLTPPNNGPLKPPNNGPPKLPHSAPFRPSNRGPSKSLYTKSQPGTTEDASVHSAKGRSVKDLARRLEQS